MKHLKDALSRDADRSDCRNILRHGSHSFYAASLLMPDEYCEPITALYAFCRIADDAVDLAEDPALGLAAVRDRLDRVYAGRPIDSPVDRTFSEVVRKYRIPMQLPAALIEGFEWDVEGRRYETMSDAYAYCTRVAGTVGYRWVNGVSENRGYQQDDFNGALAGLTLRFGGFGYRR